MFLYMVLIFDFFALEYAIFYIQEYFINNIIILKYQ